MGHTNFLVKVELTWVQDPKLKLHVTSHGYILGTHMNERTLDNNVKLLFDPKKLKKIFPNLRKKN